MAITRQQLIRDFHELLKTRGLRLAALGGAGTSSDYYKVYSHVSGNLAAPASGIQRIVFDLDQTKLDTLGEIATGAEAHVIPVPGRV